MNPLARKLAEREITLDIYRSVCPSRLVRSDIRSSPLPYLTAFMSSSIYCDLAAVLPTICTSWERWSVFSVCGLGAVPHSTVNTDGAVVFVSASPAASPRCKVGRLHERSCEGERGSPELWRLQVKHGPRIVMYNLNMHA
ncbi:hypothetical protein J6590_012197 [Homalodisca vitripennis]|nr:hypothetical protein J6590_012197 [Homalodisca vitripennis]